jgi:hypothetical protein
MNVTLDIVNKFKTLFVNRRAYTMQAFKPDEHGDFPYYRQKRPLRDETVKAHLQGKITIGLYAINPDTQASKWLAIDADYKNALEDLLRLQDELLHDGVSAALEKSRRGGHLWIFNERPLPAARCRLYIYNVAKRLDVRVKNGKFEGLEIFPRQDALRPGQFGNALRAPLGLHRKAGKRFWFYHAEYTLEAQIEYLWRLERLTEERLNTLTEGLSFPEEYRPPEPVSFNLPPGVDTTRWFRIREHVRNLHSVGKDFKAQCPSCAQKGKDTAMDNLSISGQDEFLYHCFAGCTSDDIRAALGCPKRSRLGSG